MEAYEITREKRFLEIALSAAHFVINDLHRTEYKDGFLFSYSPLQGNDTVFNASLLGSRLLSFATSTQATRNTANLQSKA